VTHLTSLQPPRRVIVVAALALAAAVAAPATGVRAQSGQPETTRRAGDDRFETAATVSEADFDAGVPVAYVATGLGFADALAGGVVAGVNGGPVVLVTTDGIPGSTADELQRLNPGRIVVLGGPQAISEDVENELAQYTEGSVDRLAGDDRYGTAAEVSQATFDPGVPVAYVATGLGFADALAGGVAAAVNGGPVALVTRDEIPGPTADELQRLDPGRIVVLGGTQVVSGQVADELEQYTEGSVERLAGNTRYGTAAAVSQATFTDPGSVDSAYMATGLDYPDALAGVPAAAQANAPVLLVPGDCVPQAADDEADRLGISQAVILGGEQAVAEPGERLVPCGETMEVSVIEENLQAPWDVAFTEDGAYITERDTGRLLLRSPDGSVSEVQRFDVDNEGEGGLLGLAPSPNFAEDNLLYVFYTTDSDNRIERFQPGQPGEVILQGLPDASIHDAGRLAFGPDGKLYVATGDAGQGSRSQDRDSRAGKILRMNPDGSVPSDNPRSGSLIYALGMRDPQGLAWDADDRLFTTEFGPDRDDEINRVTADGNYGWPQVTGRENNPNFIDPVVVRQPPVASWSGAEILTDARIPEWENDLFAASLRGERLWHFELDDQGQVVGAEDLYVDRFGRLRTAIQAPDGSLWLLTSNRDGRGSPVATDDRIIRIGPPKD
jgi:glucose/arabinose dehydrogenase